MRRAAAQAAAGMRATSSLPAAYRRWLSKPLTRICCRKANIGDGHARSDATAELDDTTFCGGRALGSPMIFFFHHAWSRQQHARCASPPRTIDVGSWARAASCCLRHYGDRFRADTSAAFPYYDIHNYYYAERRRELPAPARCARYFHFLRR